MGPDGFSSREEFALIRCDGGGVLGLDHVKRMVALARALRDGEGMVVGFAVHGGDDAVAPIHRAGFEARLLAAEGEFSALVKTRKPDLLLLDCRDSPTLAEAQSWRRDTTLMAAIDDVSDLRLACDFAYYPPLPQVAGLDWTGARTVPRIGWDYVLLGVTPHPVPARAPGARPTLLITMGGSDPHRLTERAARLLATLDTTFRIRFVIGGGMKDAGKVAAGIVAIKNTYETIEGADDLSTEYASADLALCAFGVTAAELAAFGVPALYLGLTADHVRSAAVFASAGLGTSLGIADRVTDSEILGAVKALMTDPARRREMRHAGLATLDGGGAARIAADLAQALREERRPAVSSGSVRTQSVGTLINRV
jgi:spore coat polysaccharide biosynthesis protein SpsF